MSGTFVTFGDSVRYRDSVKRLAREAVGVNLFNTILAWNETDLKPDYVNAHRHFINANPRGLGYWIWKPQVILQALEKTPPGGFLVYADAGCSFNRDQSTHPRIMEYVEKARASKTGIMAFELTFLENRFTKMDTAAHIFPDVRDCVAAMDSCQCMATVIVMVNTPEAMAFVKEWRDTCVANNYTLVSDKKSVLENYNRFVDHRHDQSIFSLLVKKYGGTSIPDETWHPMFDQMGWPIHASRIRK